MTTTTVDRHAWATDVAAALAALPTVQADTLRLLYFEHLTDEQIATRLGVTLNHARTASAEGLRRLGQALRVLPPLQTAI